MAEVRFHKELYSKAALEEAIKVYGALCTMKLVPGKTHYVLRITDGEDQDGVLADDIANYVLAESVKRS